MTSFCMEKFVLAFCCLVWFCVLLVLFWGLWGRVFFGLFVCLFILSD